MCLGVFYVHFVYRSLPRSVRWLGRDSVLFSSFFFVLLLGLSHGSVSTLLCPSRFVPAPPLLLGLLRFSPHLAFFFWCCCDSLCSPLLISRHLFFRSAALHLSWIDGLEGRCLRFGPAAGGWRPAATLVSPGEAASSILVSPLLDLCFRFGESRCLLVLCRCPPCCAGLLDWGYFCD